MILVERDLDGPVPGQADHPAGAAAGRRGPRDRRGPFRAPRRARRPPTSSDRWWMPSTGWRTSWRPAAVSSNARRWTSSGSTPRSRSGGGFTEAMLERVATGVVTVDAGGRIGTVNPAAARLLGLDAGVVGQPAPSCSAEPDLQPLARCCAERSQPARERPRAGDLAGARRPRGAAGGGGDAAARRRRRGGRPRAGARRHHAADPRAEGGGVARGGAPARPRDQEPADADPALRPAPAAPVRRRRRPGRGRWWTSARHDRRRGRVAEGAGGRVLAVRADAGAAPRADRRARAARRARWRSTTACSSTSASRRCSP